jgi:NTE family protein
MLEWATRKAPSAVLQSDTIEPQVSTAFGAKGGGTHAPSMPTSKHDNHGIALALGGGVAKGWAHIGVLRALDEHKIPVKMIAGTSIGALVGGCYLAGKLDELEDFARSLTKKRIFGLLDFHLGGNGLLGGLKLDQKLRSHLEDITFSDLPKPFIAVAAEIKTGHEIWISSGSLVNAMRASFALPGVFEPVVCNNRLLVDGALVNPVPVSVCRAYEQMAVVAVNMHYDHFGRAAVIRHDAGLTDRERLSSGLPVVKETMERSQRLGITGTMVEAFNIIQDRISRAKLAGDPPDLAIHPKLGNIGLTEFHRADELIQIGYEATLNKLEDIERLQLAYG